MPVLEYHPDRADGDLKEMLATEAAERIKKLFSDKKIAPKILDIGTGRGLFVSECLKEGFDVYGLDIAKRYEGDKSRLTIVDARFLPFRDKSFDMVFQHLFFEDMTDLQHLRENEVLLTVNEIHRILKQNGFVYSFHSQFILGDKMENRFKNIIKYSQFENIYIKI